MKHKKLFRLLSIPLLLLSVLVISPMAYAASGGTSNGTNSFGLQGTIPHSPPSQGASITSPPNNSTTTNGTITVSGTCPSGTLVEVFDNNVFVGSTVCTNGSFSLQISLFGGTNNLTALVFDNLGQSGPNSNTVTVTYLTQAYGGLGSSLTLTTQYAKRGVNPGETLTWPIVINGGVPPYTIVVDWGDGQTAQTYTQSVSGTLNISHIYSSAGTYTITIRVTDKSGQSAFIQVVGVANGAISAQGSNSQGGTNVITKTIIIWWPLIIAIPFIIISFWLGRRYQIGALRRLLEREGR